MQERPKSSHSVKVRATATVGRGVGTAVSRPHVLLPTHLWSSPGQVNAVILDVVRRLLFAAGEVKH